MISRLFGRAAKSISWPRAAGEVALIVLGITIALAADSWWSKKQDDKEEIALLGQTLVSLKSDVQDLRDGLALAEDRAERYAQLQTHVLSKLPYSDDLQRTFRLFTGWQTARINAAPYEALKARGLDLISNPDLRLQLIDFFDQEVPGLADRDAIDRTQTIDFVQPYFRSRFKYGHEPLDYETLITDPEFLYILAHRTRIYESRTVPRYREVVALAESLISSLEDELIARQ